MDHPREHFLEITDSDKLLNTCIALKGIGRDYQQDFLRDAIRNRQYYLGNQYLRAVGDKLEYRRRKPGEEWRPQTVRNVIGQTIDPNHAIVASASPKINIEACFPDQMVSFSAANPVQNLMSEGAYENTERYDTPYDGRTTGEKATELLDRIWNSPYRKEYHQRANSLLDAYICGTSFRGYGVRQHPFRGAEVTVNNLQPHQILLDPEGRDMITFEDFRFIIVITELDVMTIKRKYGVKEEDYGNEDENAEYDDSTSAGFINRLFRKDHTQSNRDGGTDVREEWSLRRYPVYTLYYAGWMPDLMAASTESLEDPNEFPYPRGRMVTWINDKKIVEDKEVETWGFTFPIVAFTPNPMSHTGYGQAEVGKLIGPQDLINAFANIIVSNAILNGHTQLMIETGAIDPRTFTVRPGAVMNFARDALRSGRIKQLLPGPLGNEIVQYMLNLEHFTKEEVGDASGILRGDAPGTIKSGLHAKTVQESAFTQKSFTIGLLDNSYEMGAFKEFNLMQQYVPLSNNYYRGYMGIEEGLDLAIQNLVFKIVIESRKDLPFSSGGQFELYFAMLRSGDINHKEFFELTKFHISEEWKEKCEEAAQDAIPGLPPEIRAQQQMAAEAQAQEAALLTEQIGAGGGLPPGAQGGGGGQQQPPNELQVGNPDQVSQADIV